MEHLNVEFKARCDDHEKVRRFLKERDAEFKGIDFQKDTYFNVQTGRLKIREGTIENKAIYYERKDKKGSKDSIVTLAEAGPGMVEVLKKVLDVLVVVDKRREIYFLDNVKFHIDQVFDLGRFIEVEAINRGGLFRKEALRVQSEFYKKAFGVRDSDLIDVSYSDMLLQK